MVNSQYPLQYHGERADKDLRLWALEACEEVEAVGIGAVAEITGVEVYILRYWERGV